MKMDYHGPSTISAYGDINGIPSSIQRALSCTGDGDFTNAIHQLQMRRYAILLPNLLELLLLLLLPPRMCGNGQS